MERRLLIAMALSLIIVFGFQKFFTPQTQTNQTQSAQPDKKTSNIDYSTPLAKNSAKEERTIPEREVEIETDKYILTFSNVGGSLTKIASKEYRDNGDFEVLLNAENPKERPFNVSSEVFGNTAEKKFVLSTHTDEMIQYTATIPGLVEITKSYKFHNSIDYIGFDVEIKNLTSGALGLSYQIAGAETIQKSGTIKGRNFIETYIMLDGKLKKIKTPKAPKTYSGEIDYIAIKNRYFAIALKPLSIHNQVISSPGRDKNNEVFIRTDKINLQEGQNFTNSYVFYAGPLDEKRLIEAGGEEFGKLINYGFFGGISKLLLGVLGFFFKWTKNWGVAIVLLTLVINLLLFPLTKKSFLSMQQMKQLQPHMEKLKEIHKDNPQKLNQEMMELYKKYNVNPLGGCLPLLLQMPIFISLYQALMKSIQIKGAEFLWIKDLAKPDAVPLPFTAPLIGASINILPLLMVVMMFLQQRITQGMTMGAGGNQAGQQKMMMVIFPLFFGFLFYSMPSGLVLYWLTNTVLMSIEQGMLSKQVARS